MTQRAWTDASTTGLRSMAHLECVFLSLYILFLWQMLTLIIFGELSHIYDMLFFKNQIQNVT